MTRLPAVRLAAAVAAFLLLAAVAPARPRVIVLGFDGVDHDLCREYLEAGDLPNLARLREMGGFRPLMPSNPAQSPVSWASFATGTNPGRTGIYDFLRRKPGTYRPTIALAEKVPSRAFTPQVARRWLLRLGAGLAGLVVGFLLTLAVLRRIRPVWIPVGLALGLAGAGALEWFFLRHVPYELPTAVNLRQGDTFWQVLDREGIPCVVVEAPTSFPADRTEHGKVLAGLGVPDVNGGWGLYYVFTDDEEVPRRTEMGTIIRHVAPAEDGRVRTWIRGPENFLLPAEKRAEIRRRIRDLHDLIDLEMGDADVHRATIGELERTLYASVPLELLPRPERGEAVVRIGEQERTLRVGTWSDHVVLDFELNPVVRPSGIARLLLVRCDETAYTLVLSQINWNPKKVPPNVPITHPAEWAGELAGSLDFFDTLGWACITSGLKDEILGEDAFLAHTSLLWDAREEKARLLLDRGGWECFVDVFTETDRIQHMMWRLIDERSPKYDAGLAALYGDSIREAYRRMDRFVGEVMERHLDGNTVLVVCSDHGFESFRRGVNLNTWLVRNGYMALKGQGSTLRLEDLFDPEAEFFDSVDWSRTRAYSMGLGKIYVNLRGREPEGIVDPADRAALCDEIAGKLLELRDDDDGGRVVRAVYRAEDIYHGDRLAQAEDLVLGFESGYRVGWQTTLGGVPPDVIRDNDQKWSGDHCSVDPSLVRGILFSSVPITEDDPHIEDIGPSVLALMGVSPASLPAEERMDGRVVLAAPGEGEEGR